MLLKQKKANPDIVTELGDVYAIKPTGNRQGVRGMTSKSENVQASKVVIQSPQQDMRFVDAIKQALMQSMEQHPNLILMGQDIAGYGGAFKITEGFAETFGKDRVRNTPLCESAIVGAALGLSLEGYKKHDGNAVCRFCIDWLHPNSK